MHIIDHPSPNFGPRPSPVIDMLVLHYTGMRSGPEALERLCDPAAGVSAHWLIEEDGTIFRLVDETARAHHAGVSFWQGVGDLNARSIGIELVNPGHAWGYRAFPPVQMQALVALAHEITARHSIPAKRVLGHSDIAPTRKQDPGELFDWRWLAHRGIGSWPDPDRPSEMEISPETAGEALTAIGYDPDPAIRDAVIITFQRHWCPHRSDGVLDAMTMQRLAAVHTMSQTA